MGMKTIDAHPWATQWPEPRMTEAMPRSEVAYGFENSHDILAVRLVSGLDGGIDLGIGHHRRRAGGEEKKFAPRMMRCQSFTSTQP